MLKVMQSYYRVGRRPVFRKFWLGMLISRAGDAFTTIALSWLVLQIAGPAELGIVLLCFGIPRILSGPIAGHLIDHVQPRLLLGWDNALRGLLIAVLPFLDYIGDLRIGYVYAIASLSAGLSAITEVAERALVPRMVEDDELESANSLLSINWEVAYIVGPSISGLIVATLGARYALVIDAASFAVMSLVCFTLPPMQIKSAGLRNMTRGFFHNWLGFRILLRFPLVLVVTISTAGYLFLGGMAEVFYPVYTRDALHASAGAYGVIVAATGVGSLCGVVLGLALFSKFPARLRVGLVLMSGAPLFALLTITSNVTIAVAIVAIASFLWGPYYVIERSLVQRAVPDELQGQVVGARMAVSTVGFPLGSAVAGFLLAHTTPWLVALLMAVAYVGLGLLPILASPRT